MTSYITKFNANLNNGIQHIKHSGIIGHVGFIRNFFMGAGLAYAIKEEKYWHLPFIVIWASPYVGYQSYNNRDRILQYVREQCPRHKQATIRQPELA